MKKHLLLLFALMALTASAYAYDFSAVAPSGQTLYYNILFDRVSVTYPGSDYENPYDSCSTPTGALTIPDSVTYNNITYPVTEIGNRAFYGCSGLSSVTIPDAVTYIGNYAFYGCSSLSSVTIPAAVTIIGGSAFANCSSLTSLYFNAISCGDFYLGYTPIWGCDSLATVVIGDGVTRIPNNFVRYCSGLTSVTIPNSVTYIGYGAFNFCRALSSVTIPDSVTYIGDMAFYACFNLPPVTIPDAVTYIGECAFSSCTTLTSITIPQSVTFLGHSAFSGCTGVTSVYFNAANCADIQGDFSSFSGCASLNTMIFGDSVSRIPAHLIDYCNSLNSVTIGSSVTTIGSQAFYGCNGISNVYARPQTAPTLGSSAITTSATIHIPCNSTASYNSTWGNSYSFTEGVLYDLTIGVDDSTQGIVTITHQPTCANDTAILQADAFSHFRFSHWNDGDTTNPRAVTVTRDTAFTAFFEPLRYTVTVLSDDTTMGTVSGGGSYIVDSSATLAATPISGFYFVHWNDGNTDNPRVITVTRDTAFTAHFEHVQHIITAVSNDATMGYVSGSGTYNEGSTATLVATPYYGNYFTRWNDGDTTNPRTITVTKDASYTAHFKSTEGIEEAGAAAAKVYVTASQIVVLGANGQTVTLYDISGRTLSSRTEAPDEVRFNTPATGLYLLRIGDHTVRKISVVR